MSSVSRVRPASVWAELNTSIDRPLTNRAIAGVYPPGSTFKPFMALAALEMGKRTPRSQINDPGYFIFGDRRFRYRWGGDFRCAGRGFRRRNLDTTCATPNDIGANAPFDNGFMGFSSSLSFVFRFYYAIGNDLFFTDMDLGFFLGG